MKKKFLSILIIATTAAYTHTYSVSFDNCTDWARWIDTGIHFRQCVDQFDTRYFQFYNGYDFEVRIEYKLTYSDGTKFEGGTYIDPKSNGDQTGTAGRGVTQWQVLKKQLKKNGSWTDF
jgi:hypothetical protein